MTALVQKDLYVLWKQVRITAFLILFYALFPMLFLNIFGVVYGAILPYTAMAYDERAKWDQLAAMMPYRDRDLVLSKYALGALFSAVAAVTAGVAQLVVHQFYQTESGVWFTPSFAAVSFGMALVIMAVSLPVLFRFTVEKARVVMFILIFAVSGGAGALASMLEEAGFFLSAGLSSYGPAAMVLLGLALTCISVPISVKMYQRRKL